MVSPSTKRRAVQHVVEQGLGITAQACRALGLARSSFYRSPVQCPESRELQADIVEKSGQHPRYGYRRITAVMRREGTCVNPKRVQRVRREEGLQVRKKQKRTRRTGVSTAERQKAVRPNHVWSRDFVHDQTMRGSRFRILTLIDEYTRELLALHAGWSIRAEDVIEVVNQSSQVYGCPEHIRSDNGPEFIAYAVEDWMKAGKIQSLYIRPGAPWEQAYIESFHDKLRDECLNRELFGSLAEARVILAQWKREYNEQRPHSSLGYRTPREVAQSHPRSGRDSGSDEYGGTHSRLYPALDLTKQPDTNQLTPAGL